MCAKLLSQGQVQVYTGKGKGKTTAAFGLAFRAAGRGYPVYIGQFLKKGEYGEHQAIKWSGGLIKVQQFGVGGFVGGRGNATEQDKALAAEGLASILQALLSEEYALVVADEINVAVEYGLVAEQDVLDLIRQRPDGVELVLTGRYASAAIIEAADLVTELLPVKHYYQAGLSARDGIER